MQALRTHEIQDGGKTARMVLPALRNGEAVSKRTKTQLSPEAIDALFDSRDAAYSERNKLVAAMSKLLPAHLCRHPEEDASWENDWRWIVCIHAPAGQMTWHIHDDEAELFAHLPVSASHWDGHTTDEKYVRLARLPGGVISDVVDQAVGLIFEMDALESPVSKGQTEYRNLYAWAQNNFRRKTEAKEATDGREHTAPIQ